MADCSAAAGLGLGFLGRETRVWASARGAARARWTYRPGR